MVVKAGLSPVIIMRPTKAPFPTARRQPQKCVFDLDYEFCSLHDVFPVLTAMFLFSNGLLYRSASDWATATVMLPFGVV